jgi:ribose-phosphate pyrophosphokinase
MANREEKRNLETIPVGSLGIISLPGCKPLGEKVDQYLVKWRAERESEHKESLAFAGYQRESYLLDAKVPRFGSGEAKGQILESVRGTDLYLLVDVLNYSMTYSLCGNENHMSPDDHYQDLKRIIAAVGGKARRHSHHAFPVREPSAQENFPRVSGLCTGTAGAGKHGCRQHYHFRCS